MTSRFVWLVLFAVLVTTVPHAASAQTENKTTLVFEIKNDLSVGNIYNFFNKPEKIDPSELVGPPMPPAKPAVTSATTTKGNYVLPPKVEGDAKVYMQEPEIRAYICPKLGDKCNTFIAVLKAENGTHECTRDNRGLNRNGSVDIGLAQINWKPGSPHSFEQLQDCKYNLDVALSMYARRGFQPWYAYTKGAYLRHLPAVLASARLIESQTVSTTTN